MRDFMRHFFGSISERYVDLFIERASAQQREVDHASEIGIINLTMNDCLDTMMSPEHAQEARESLDQQLNP